MADLHTFWNELDALPTEEAPLTAAESDRLADAVLAKVHVESGEAPRKKSVHRAKSAKRRRVPIWGRALAGVAACMAVLCGVNTVNPALAEGLPFVGDVFSFLNQHDSKNQLKSDRLSGYAQQAAVPAVPESQSETGESSTASPYTLTLNQVYCDGLYLRIGLTLTAPDGNDSLAGYDWLAQNPGGEGWIEICQAQADGTLLANGQALYPQNGFVFEKVDGHTYAAAMDYDLADYNGDTAAIDCQLTVAGLTGVQNAYDADGSYLRTRLDGRWKLNFTVSSDDMANRIGTVSEPEVNGYTLSSVIAAPGETRVTVQLSADAPEGATLQLFSADGQKLQCASSRPSADSSTVSYDFDAAPADAAGLTVKLVDKNTDPLVELAQWDVSLPTE